MRPYNLLWSLATAASLKPFVGARSEDFPVGISLRHTELLSAYYDSAKELHFVTTIESSKEWQDHFWKTYQDGRELEPYNDLETVSMYARTLQEIKNATEDKLGRPVTIGAIDYPEHLTQGVSSHNIFLAAEKEGIFSNPRQLVRHRNTARYAYKLDTCEAYGFPPDCDMDDLYNQDSDQQHTPFVIVVEYDREYFSLGIMSCGSIWCSGNRIMQSTIYGEHSIGTTLNNLENERTKLLIATIQQFLTEKLKELEHGEAIPDLRPHIKAVILSGQASTPSMNDMKHVLASAIPSFADRFRFTIDPRLVGAAGAARWAEHSVSDDTFLNPSWGIEQQPPADHDEL